MIEFWNYVLHGIAIGGILCGFWVVSHLSVPQMDYEDDWRANL